MARFDVHRNANRASSKRVPFLVDVQHDLLSVLATRVVIPLYAAAEVPKPLSRLSPPFEVAGMRVVLMTSEMAGVRGTALGAVVGSLAGDQAEIARAIDFLLTGV